MHKSIPAYTVPVLNMTVRLGTGFACKQTPPGTVRVPRTRASGGRCGGESAHPSWECKTPAASRGVSPNPHGSGWYGHSIIPQKWLVEGGAVFLGLCRTS